MPNPSIPAETKQIRVLLIGNELVTRAGLRMLLDSKPGLQVVGEVDCSAGLRSAVKRTRPDVALLDPDDNPVGVIPDAVPALVRTTPVIILSSASASTLVSSAFRHGAMGLVLKHQAPEMLVKAIVQVHGGEVWLDRRVTARFFRDLSEVGDSTQHTRDAAKTAQLTKREREVTTLIGTGLRNMQVAERLFISEVTVRNHLTSIFRKLGFTNRVQLVLYALQQGLTRLPLRIEPSAMVPARRTARTKKSAS